MAHLNWGMVLLNLGKRQEAADKLGRAVELQPSLRPFVDQALGQKP